jgi:hypothetical protein
MTSAQAEYLATIIPILETVCEGATFRADPESDPGGVPIFATLPGIDWTTQGLPELTLFLRDVGWEYQIGWQAGDVQGLRMAVAAQFAVELAARDAQPFMH